MEFPYFHIVREAGLKAIETIIEVYNTDFDVQIKADDSPVTKADKRSSKIICDCLEQTGHIIISEEENKIPFKDRQNEPIWLVDPLDGTKEFIRKNGEFCINIALIENQKPKLGFIIDVLNRSMIFGGSENGAFIMDIDILDSITRLEPINEMNGDLSLVYSRSHLHPKANLIIERLNNNGIEVEIIRKGSALKFFDLVQNRAQLYPRIGPTMEWDIAAGDAIYGALGGEVLDFHNFEPLKYNKESLYNPPFIAKHKNFPLDKIL